MLDPLHRSFAFLSLVFAFYRHCQSQAARGSASSQYSVPLSVIHDAAAQSPHSSTRQSIVDCRLSIVDDTSIRHSAFGNRHYVVVASRLTCPCRLLRTLRLRQAPAASVCPLSYRRLSLNALSFLVEPSPRAPLHFPRFRHGSRRGRGPAAKGGVPDCVYSRLRRRRRLQPTLLSFQQLRQFALRFVVRGRPCVAVYRAARASGHTFEYRAPTRVITSTGTCACTRTCNYVHVRVRGSSGRS